MRGSPRGLADTGAILALVDRNDRWHQRCASSFSSLPLPLATSAAVITELFHLLGPRFDQAAVWQFLQSDVVTVLSIGDADLPDLETLMLRYRDRPMDFADATLVHLAKREGLSTVFTIDHDDFETYRIEGKRAFHIVPSRR
jgi:uncharacterized protein